jgi:hypothetical protein
MSFAGPYEERFQKIIRPAIEEIDVRKEKLRANRVDLSKSGDSILTDIMDGIAHSELVLVDVSTVGNDTKTGERYRNGNVMYELGLALACRQPSEVLLIRDDQDKFLFDVSTIPHKHMDFTDPEEAKAGLKEELHSRFRERNHLRDARILLAVAALTGQERNILNAFSAYGAEQTFWLQNSGFGTIAGLPRLLDKQLITTAGVTDDGQAMFRWTRLGYVIANNLESLVPTHTLEKPDEESAETLKESGSDAD